jgi:cardiolipin synthase
MSALTTAEWLAFVWVALWVGALLTAPSVLLQRQGRPLSAVSWLFAMFALPPLALLAWWLFGRTYLSRRRLMRRHAARTFSLQLIAARGRLASPRDPGSALLNVVALPPVLRDWVFPPSGGNSAKLLIGGRVAYDAWERAILEASHHVHMLFYIWRDDSVGRRFRDLLVSRARAGVEVRVLYDDVGSLSLPRSFFRPLEAAGGRASSFMPVRLGMKRPLFHFRNHRKLVVADGIAGFVGGLNVGEEYLLWKDVAVEIRGPGVDQIQAVFADDWHFATGEDMKPAAYFGRWQNDAALDESQCAHDVSCATVASGPVEELNAMKEVLFLAVTCAKSRVWITTPYLIPDAALTTALRAAAYRGLDVRVMVPAQSDVLLVRHAARAFYPELLSAGIRIFEYDGMVHTKAVLFDEDMTLIGSANLDTRSFRLNFELSCFLEACTVNQGLSEQFARDLSRCREIDMGLLGLRSWGERVVDAAAHLLSPLL